MTAIFVDPGRARQGGELRLQPARRFPLLLLQNFPSTAHVLSTCFSSTPKLTPPCVRREFKRDLRVATVMSGSMRQGSSTFAFKKFHFNNCRFTSNSALSIGEREAMRRVFQKRIPSWQTIFRSSKDASRQLDESFRCSCNIIHLSDSQSTYVFNLRRLFL